MSVLQMTPCILDDRWAEFIEWASRLFDMPVACRFDDQGWGRLAADSPGVTVIATEAFGASSDGEKTVVELEVVDLKGDTGRAAEAGATIVTEPTEVTEGGWHAALRSPQGILFWLWQMEPETPERGQPEIQPGPINFTVDRDIDADPARVFEAVTRGREVEQFFVSKASGDFVEGEMIEWVWGSEEEGEKAELSVVEFRPNQHVAFHWKAWHLPYHTRTQFNVKSSGEGKTRLTITERGWNADTRGQKSAFAHCEGWTSFATNLQLYLERDLAIMKE